MYVGDDKENISPTDETLSKRKVYSTHFALLPL